MDYAYQVRLNFRLLLIIKRNWTLDFLFMKSLTTEIQQNAFEFVQLEP